MVDDGLIGILGSKEALMSRGVDVKRCTKNLHHFCSGSGRMADGQEKAGRPTDECGRQGRSERVRGAQSRLRQERYARAGVLV